MKFIFIFSFSLFVLSQSVFSQCSNSETYWTNHLKDRINTLDPIEGIWSWATSKRLYYNGNLNGTFNYPKNHKVAITKESGVYKLCLINWDTNVRNITIEFEKTSANEIYLLNLKFFKSGIPLNSNAILTGNALLEFAYKIPPNQLIYEVGKKNARGGSEYFEHRMIKLFPSASDFEVAKTSSKSTSGTGFAISSNGYIVTNYHVTNGANNITVRGVKGKFTKLYKAKVVAEDKKMI